MVSKPPSILGFFANGFAEAARSAALANDEKTAAALRIVAVALKQGEFEANGQGTNHTQAQKEPK